MARSASLTALISVIDKVSKPMKKITAAMREPIAAANKVGHSFAAMSTQFRGVVAPLAALTAPLGALAGGLSIAGLAQVTTGFAESGKEIQQWSQRLGIGSTALQEMLAIGQRFGVANDAMIDGIKELSLRADEFATTGKGSAEEAFQRLGLSPKQLAAVKGDTAALFELVRSRLEAVQDVAARQRIADEVFGGTAGEQLTEMLSQSADELERMRQEAHRMGIILSEKQIDQAKSFWQSVRDLEAVFSGLGNTIAAEIVPVIKPLIDDFSAWAAANREVVSVKVREMVVGVANALRSVDWASTFRSAESFAVTLSKLVSSLGGFKSVMIGAAIVMTGPLILSILQLGGAMGGLGLTLARLIGTFGLAKEAGQIVGMTFTSGPLLNGSKYLATKALPAVMKGLYSLLVVMGSGMVKAFSIAGVAVRALGMAFMSTPVGWILAAVAAIAFAVYAIYQNWDGIVAWFWEKVDKVKAAFDEGLLQGVMTAIAEFAPWRLVADAINGLVKWLFGVDLYAIGSEWFSGLGDGIMSAVDGVIASMKSGLDSVLSVLPDDLRDMVGLGTADLAVPTPAERRSVISSGSAEVRGGMTVRFENAPPGMRVDGGQSSQRGFDINADVGYRNMALGVP